MGNLLKVFLISMPRGGENQPPPRVFQNGQRKARGALLCFALFRRTAAGVPAAALQMVVHQPRRLEQGVDDGGADEGKAALFQVAADAVGERGGGGHVGIRLWAVDDGLAVDVGPEKAVEAAELPLHL